MASFGSVQRNAIPPDELRRMRDDIDLKLANQALSDKDRAQLEKDREDLAKAIGEEELDTPARPGPAPKAPLGVRPPAPPLPILQPQASPPPKAGRTKSKGSGTSRSKSAKAATAKESKSSSVPPPTATYRNENRRASADELRVGKHLNQLAVEGRLGSDVKSVEGRREAAERRGDFAFMLADGTEVGADLYNPRSAERSPEDMALAVSRKSGQADIVVVELPISDRLRALEQGHRIADALIANGNTSVKRMLVMADGKLVLDRSLSMKGRAVLNLKERVQQRAAEAKVAEQAKNPGPERSSAPDVRLPTNTTEVREALGRQSARTAAFEGVAQIFNAFMFDQLQKPEVDKIFARLEELKPRINELRSKGYTVTIWGRAEVPDQIDIAGGVTGVRDVGQVVYFVDLWLVPSMAPVIEKPPANPPPWYREPQRMYGDPTAPVGGDRVAMRAIDKFPRRGYHFADAIFATLKD
jgi:hypothetical protein